MSSESMFLPINIAERSNLHWCISLTLTIILVISTLFATVMIFSNVAQLFHNHSQDNHKFLSINSLKWKKQVGSGSGMQLLVMCLIQQLRY